MRLRLLILLFLSSLILTSAWAIDPPNTSNIYISEISASAGQITILDELGTVAMGAGGSMDADQEDWIELHNPTGSTVSLNDWAISDATAIPGKWVFPDADIGPGEYLVIFASGQDLHRTQAQIDISAASGVQLYQHTNFQLENHGEYLGLVDSASTVISEMFPEYPFQYALYSFGYDPVAGRYRYMHPTPGAANQSTEAFDGWIKEDVTFDPPRGLYNSPLSVALSTSVPGATIRYTTDRSAPGWTTGAVYTSPIPVSASTTIRAVALVPGVSQSLIATHSYLMNLRELDLALPVMSLSIDPVDYNEGPLGIAYGTNYQDRGRAWERPAHFEFFDHEKGISVGAKCGVRVHGGYSRGFPKKSLRAYFRSEYGLRELDFPVIPDSRVEQFKELVLRGGAQDSDPFVLDELNRRLMTDMGRVSIHGGLANMFRNGIRMTHYNPCERMNAEFLQSWYGGGLSWDIMGQDSPRDATTFFYTGARDGDPTVFNEILEACHRVDNEGVDNSNNLIPGFEMDPADYDYINARLHINHFADYIHLGIFAANRDWPGNNWYCARERDRVPEDRFRYYVWDHESTFGLGSPVTDNSIQNKLLNPQFKTADIPYPEKAPISEMFRGMRHSSLFRAEIAQRFRKHYFEDGALTDSNMLSEYLHLRNQIADQLEAQSAFFNGLPSYNGVVTAAWIPGRRHNVEQLLYKYNLFDPTGLSFHPRPTPGSLAINEFMAANNATIADETGEFEDWIEIYNRTTAPIDMSGMFLTDDLNEPTKWQIPTGTVIEAGDFLLVWADGEIADGTLHAGFALDRDGEEIGLFDTDSVTLLDSVEFIEQSDNVSMGRRPDGTGLFARLDNPTPGTPNGPLPRTDFLGGFEIDVGHGWRSVLTGDINNDTYLDVVLGNINHGAVMTLINQGDGTFVQAVTTDTGRVGQSDLVLGDFDGINGPDLAAINDVMYEHTVSTLLNDGAGAFVFSGSATFNTTAGTRDHHPRSAVARDLDGDNDLDLLIQNESSALDGYLPYTNVVNVMENDGSGHFTEKGSVAGGQAKLASSQALVAEDFNGDDHIDFVTLSGGNTLLFSTNDGSANFGAPTSLTPTGAKILNSVVAADVDNDGDFDLVACDGYAPPPQDTKVHVMLNDGSGNFSQGDSYRTSLRMTDTLLAGDFDNDGLVDVLVANFNPLLRAKGSMQVLFNDGEGGFFVSDEFFASDKFPFPKYLASGDLESDGDRDLCVVDEINGTLSVFLNVSIYAPPASSVDNWKYLR